MAIKILSEIDTPVGLKISGLIVSVKEGYRLIPREFRNNKTYDVVCLIYYFVDRTKKPLFEEQIKINITQDKLNNIYGAIYAYLKAKYPKSDDV